MLHAHFGETAETPNERHRSENWNKKASENSLTLTAIAASSASCVILACS